MLDYLLGPTLILLIVLGWFAVQELSRKFAARHPEFGEQEECMGCGLLGLCKSHPHHKNRNKSQA